MKGRALSALALALLCLWGCPGERASQERDAAGVQGVVAPQPARPVVHFASGPRALEPQEEEALFEATAELVCLLLQARVSASDPWSLPPELNQQAADALGGRGFSLEEMDLMLRAYQDHAPSQAAVQERVQARCPEQPQSRARELQGALPLEALLARRAPLEQRPPAELPPEGQRYVRVAGALGCLGLQGGAADPGASRGELLRQEGLDEPAWRALGQRWRQDARASTELARALGRCQ